jgi:hypothetical protein
MSEKNKTKKRVKLELEKERTWKREWEKNM